MRRRILLADKQQEEWQLTAYIYCNELREYLLVGSRWDEQQQREIPCTDYFTDICVVLDDGESEPICWSSSGQTVNQTFTPHQVGSYLITYTLADPTTIDEYAFAFCEFTHMMIPKGITDIRPSAFIFIPELSFEVHPENPVYDSRDFNIVETMANKVVVGGSSQEISNSITSIGDEAFYGRNRMYGLLDLGQITSIGECAFSYSGYQSVEIPNTVTSIGRRAFSWCENLVQVIFEQGSQLTTIPESCFEGICTENYIIGHGAVDLPASVTTVEAFAFENTGVTYITMPDTITTFGEGTFFGSKYLIRLNSNIDYVCNLPSSLTQIIYGNGNGVLRHTPFTTIVIPSGITDANLLLMPFEPFVRIECHPTTAPTCRIASIDNFANNGELLVPSGSTGYDVWMQHLRPKGWTIDYV